MIFENKPNASVDLIGPMKFCLHETDMIWSSLQIYHSAGFNSTSARRKQKCAYAFKETILQAVETYLWQY